MPLIALAPGLLALPMIAGPKPDVTVLVTCKTPVEFVPVMVPGGGAFAVAEPDPELVLLLEGARRNAEGGSPPMVSASPAFNAYGALTRRTRDGCSSCPCTWMTSQ